MKLYISVRMANYCFLLLLPGISASNYSHVKYFPSRAAYDAFYEIIVRVVNIAFEDFAAYAQWLVVRYLRSRARDVTVCVL